MLIKLGLKLFLPNLSGIIKCWPKTNRKKKKKGKRDFATNGA
jgi:hypothetical protein